MTNKSLLIGSIIAVGIIAVVICVGMVTGFPAAKPFISVDPVSDMNPGDQFIITGKTNLPAGTEMIAEIYPASYEDQTGTGSGDFTGATGTVTISRGPDNANTWSWPVDTTTFRPGEYIVSVSSVNGDLSAGEYSKGDVSAAPTFTLHQGPATADQGPYIRVDPVAGITTGDLLSVKGSTNLPAGTILMVQTGNYAGDTIVSTGTGGENRFSAPVDTSGLNPGMLTITVTQMTGDPAKGDYRQGTINGTISFTLKGAYLGTDTPVQATVTGDDFIRINAIGDRSAGDQFLITGTTSLLVGTNVIWQVIPDTGTPVTGLSHGAEPGIMANNQVTKGDGTANRVSLAVDLGSMAPGDYIAIVAILKGDLATGDVGIGDLAGSAIFTVK